MKETLRIACERFIACRDALQKTFHLENECIYPVAAHIFLAADQPVDPARLTEMKALVKGSTSLFSTFRGNVKLPLLCMLAVSDDPEGKWDLAQRYYALLKESFLGSEFLALAALQLTDTVPETEVPALAARSKALYRRMKKEHPFLTGQEDSVLASLLAQSPRSDDELLEDMEACYELLDERFPKGNGLQSSSHVLALSPADPASKTGRLFSLYDAILALGGKYGKDRQLPVLAALSLDDAPVEELAADLMDVDGFLAEQKGYRGVFGLDRRTRTMHAAMLLSACSASADLTGTVARQTTLALVAAQQVMMCAVIASSAASSAAASH